MEGDETSRVDGDDGEDQPGFDVRLDTDRPYATFRWRVADTWWAGSCVVVAVGLPLERLILTDDPDFVWANTSVLFALLASMFVAHWMRRAILRRGGTLLTRGTDRGRLVIRIDWARISVVRIATFAQLALATASATALALAGWMPAAIAVVGVLVSPSSVRGALWMGRQSGSTWYRQDGDRILLLESTSGTVGKPSTIPFRERPRLEGTRTFRWEVVPITVLVCFVVLLVFGVVNSTITTRRLIPTVNAAPVTFRPPATDPRRTVRRTCPRPAPERDVGHRTVPARLAHLTDAAWHSKLADGRTLEEAENACQIKLGIDVTGASPHVVAMSDRTVNLLSGPRGALRRRRLERMLALVRFDGGLRDISEVDFAFNRSDDVVDRLLLALTSGPMTAEPQHAVDTIEHSHTMPVRMHGSAVAEDVATSRALLHTLDAAAGSTVAVPGRDAITLFRYQAELATVAPGVQRYGDWLQGAEAGVLTLWPSTIARTGLALDIDVRAPSDIPADRGVPVPSLRAMRLLRDLLAYADIDATAAGERTRAVVLFHDSGPSGPGRRAAVIANAIGVAHDLSPQTVETLRWKIDEARCGCGDERLRSWMEFTIKDGPRPGHLAH